VKSLVLATPKHLLSDTTTTCILDHFKPTTLHITSLTARWFAQQIHSLGLSIIHATPAAQAVGDIAFTFLRRRLPFFFPVSFPLALRLLVRENVHI